MLKISCVGLLLLAVVMLAAPASPAQLAVGISVGFGPPALPVYEQPLCPAPDYIWTPGYWAYDPDLGDYYWVPGTWVLAPEAGLLWTPPWWGWNGAAFAFHEGYWGPHIGFYGGIAYGFGYFGVGFEGGYWQGGHFFYNRSVTNVNVTEIHNVYSRTVVNNVTVNRVSYNGGQGGITARPTREEEEADHDRHIPPSAEQTRHVQTARSTPELRASANHGKPPVAATAKPGNFSGRGVERAKEAGAPYHPPANAHAAVHPNEIPSRERSAAPNTGDAKLDKKYRQEQDKLNAKQDKERQQLQSKQDKEHQQQDRQKVSDEQRQQLEQKHQQETQALQRRHTQEQQRLQERQRPKRK